MVYELFVAKQAGSNDRALQLLTKVLDNKPDHFLANKNVAAVYARKGEIFGNKM